MKKQLFSLMMAFALVVGLSVSALAQSNGLTIGTAYWHMPGSVHGVQVVSHAGSTYTWSIENVDCATGNPAGTSNGASIAAVSGSEWQADITYTAAASGVYVTQVIENGTDGCTTIRRFYTAVMDIDLIVIASTNLGAAPADLSTCNDYSLLSLNTPNTLVENTDADDNTNSLQTWTPSVGANPYFNIRWVDVSLSVSSLAGACTVNNSPAASDFSWQFDYAIAGANYVDGTNDNFQQLNNAIVRTTTGPTTVTYGGATDPTNNVTVAAGITAITIPLQSTIRWATDDTNQDQTFTFTASGLVLDGSDTDTNFDDGGESTTNASSGNNVSAAQTIYAAPATPRITIND